MRPLLPILATAAAGALMMLALPVTGLLDHGARPGSNSMIDWYSLTAARQSIALRSLFITVPDLDDPVMVQRGAGHFELVCASCHGSPAKPAARFAQDMSPQPPRLTSWRPDARLFQTVKYGIRHTAMPAWPTHLREDEIWDMVAFLKRVRAMSATEYAELAFGTAEPGSCAACHGENGEGRNNAFPRLDIQSSQYIADALRAFRNGSRHSGTMMAAARQLSDADIAALAQQFGQGRQFPTGGHNPLGARIARDGFVTRDIPACDHCHSATARPEFPRLAGQTADYLRLQLELFQKHGAERGGRYAEIMAKVVEDALQHGPHRLEPDEIEAVARHYGQ